MQLSSSVHDVHQSLLAAAALGDERTREIATGLAAAAAPAIRLAVLDALYAAADEITAALLDHPGAPAVDVRPDPGGDEVTVAVRTTAAVTAPAEPRAEDGEANARISLRLSEQLKTDIEQAAAKDGVSVNAWLVRAATAALEPSPFAGFGALGNLGDLGALGNRLGRMSGFGRGFAGSGTWPESGGAPGGPGGGFGGHRGGGQRITGWIDG